MYFYINSKHATFIYWYANAYAKTLLYNCSTYPSHEAHKSRCPELLASRSSGKPIHQHLSHSLLESWSSLSFEQRSLFECRLGRNSHGATRRKWSGWSCWDGRSGWWVCYRWMMRSSKLYGIQREIQHSENSEYHKTQKLIEDEHHLDD